MLSTITPEQSLEIAEKVGRHFGVTMEELKAHNRRDRVHLARSFAWLCLYHRNVTFSEIGRLFNRHHSAVSNSVRKLEDHISVDGEMKSIWNTIKGDVCITGRKHVYVAKGTMEATVTSSQPLKAAQIVERARMALENGTADVEFKSVDRLEERAA